MAEHTRYETHDGRGAGDHDEPFTFGFSLGAVACMGVWERIHLKNLRSDFRDGKTGGVTDGAPYVQSPDSGLWIPPDLKP